MNMIIVVIVIIIIIIRTRMFFAQLLPRSEFVRDSALPFFSPTVRSAHAKNQDSSKGGTVETGCSGLHYIIVIGCFIVQYCLHPLHPPPTAPPFDEYPKKDTKETSSHGTKQTSTKNQAEPLV